MSAPSENMPIAVSAPKPLLLRHAPYFIGAAIVVALAATVQFDGYVHNILMQATTFAIAVFGLSVVLGLCGQINLAQAAFFGFGAYAVGIGTSDYQISYWLCLVAGCLMALVAGAVLGMSTLRLGGHYLAMVTISFQQIVTLIMINAIWLHAWAGRCLAHRPAGAVSIRASLSCVLRGGACHRRLYRLAPAGYQARAGHAGGARQRTCCGRHRGRRVPHQGFRLCAECGAGWTGGGLFAGGFAYVSPDQFSFAESVVFLTMALLGGVASPIGSAIGTGLLILIPEWLRFLKSVPGLYLAIYGLAVILIMRLHARRHLGIRHTATARWRAR